MHVMDLHSSDMLGLLVTQPCIIALHPSPEPSQFAGHEKPRALQPPSPAPAPDYGFPDYDQVPLKETDEYDAFDYVNGDFDKVAATRPTLPRPGVVSHTRNLSFLFTLNPHP